MAFYWVAQGRCVHPLCASQDFQDRPDRGWRRYFCDTEAEADEFLKKSEVWQRRCPDCRRPIAGKRFRKERRGSEGNSYA